MFGAVLFDMDGVLVDSEPYNVKALKETFDAIGVNFPESYYEQFIGSYFKRSRRIMKTDMPSLSQAVFDEALDKMIQTVPPYPEILFKNAKATLIELYERGYKIGLCSSSPMTHIQACIDQCGLSQYLDVVISGDELKESKPNPEIYLLAAKRLGVEAYKCLVIEDSKAGIEAGKKAGMYVLGIKDTRYGLDQIEADELIEDISELLNRITFMEEWHDQTNR